MAYADLIEDSNQQCRYKDGFRSCSFYYCSPLLPSSSSCFYYLPSDSQNFLHLSVGVVQLPSYPFTWSALKLVFLQCLCWYYLNQFLSKFNKLWTEFIQHFFTICEIIFWTGCTWSWGLFTYELRRGWFLFQVCSLGLGPFCEGAGGPTVTLKNTGTCAPVFLRSWGDGTGCGFWAWAAFVVGRWALHGLCIYGYAGGGSGTCFLPAPQQLAPSHGMEGAFKPTLAWGTGVRSPPVSIRLTPRGNSCMGRSHGK